jgi:undecaprenyl-diphosphatase
MFKAIVLGVLQGLTEFIPVSSSAHLIILPWFLKWEGIINSLSFGVALHFGTLLSLLYYFRRDWIDMFKGVPAKEGLFRDLTIGTLPALTVGLFLHEWLSSARDPVTIIITLSAVSVLMLLAEKMYGPPEERADFEKISQKDALFIGFAQVFALIPGVSRSGITIVAGLARGYRREAAAKFSFMLSTPVVAGACILEGRKLIGAEGIDLSLFFTGIIASAVTGFLVIKYLLYFFRNHTLRPFAYYRFFLASVIILTIWIRSAG